MQRFRFYENDTFGFVTLDTLGNAGKLNRWMYQTIKPFCKGSILEIGCGIGNISQYFLEDNFPVSLSDIRQTYCDLVRDRFSSSPNLQGVIKLDIAGVDFQEKYGTLFNSFDTVVMLNVLEHIADEDLAIQNASKLLKEDGHLIILVPAYPKLYNRFDTDLGHERRYKMNTLQALMQRNNMNIFAKKHFNLLGIFAWLVSGTLLKNSSLPVGQVKVFNYLVPLARIIDRLVFHKIGLSALVIAKKKQ